MSETTLNPSRPMHLLGIELSKTTRAVILVIGGIKGGIGKSTSAIMLAHVWAAMGLRVLVIDADPKSGSARKWARACRAQGAQLPFTVKAHPSEDLEDTIVEEGWQQQYDLIIIDTGGDNDRILRAAYQIADYMLLTTSPSPMDVVTLRDTARTVAGEFGERDIPVSLLVTSVKSDRMAKATKDELRKVGLSVLSNTVKHRTAYQTDFGWPVQNHRDYGAVQYELDTP